VAVFIITKIWKQHKYYLTSGYKKVRASHKIDYYQKQKPTTDTWSNVSTLKSMMLKMVEQGIWQTHSPSKTKKYSPNNKTQPF
jgi:hypothetical protein